MTDIPNRPPPGPMARRAGQLCHLERFRLYLDHAKRARHGIHANALPDGTHQVEDAADFLRTACGVSSSAELDTDKRAAHMLRRIIADYRRWHSAGAARQGVAPCD